MATQMGQLGVQVTSGLLNKYSRQQSCLQSQDQETHLTGAKLEVMVKTVTFYFQTIVVVLNLQRYHLSCKCIASEERKKK